MNRYKLAKELYFSGIFILCFIFFVYIFFFINYVHEAGHIILGFGNNLFLGKITHFSIGAWVPLPFFNFILLPQQTRIIENNYGSDNFILGGPIFTILVFLGISLFAYLRSKKPAWFLLFISILLFEISGNIICGTDNLTGSPLVTCIPALNLPIQLLAIAIFSGTFSYFTTKKLMSWKYLKIRRL